MYLKTECTFFQSQLLIEAPYLARVQFLGSSAYKLQLHHTEYALFTLSNCECEKAVKNGFLENDWRTKGLFTWRDYNRDFFITNMEFNVSVHDVDVIATMTLQSLNCNKQTTHNSTMWIALKGTFTICYKFDFCERECTNNCDSFLDLVGITIVKAKLVPEPIL